MLRRYMCSQLIRFFAGRKDKYINLLSRECCGDQCGVESFLGYKTMQIVLTHTI